MRNELDSKPGIECSQLQILGYGRECLDEITEDTLICWCEGDRYSEKTAIKESARDVIDVNLHTRFAVKR